MQILVVNCGSSSLKFAVIDSADGKEAVSGLAQRLGSPQASLSWKAADGKSEAPLTGGTDHAAALRAVADGLKQRGLAAGIGGIGHRVVHGGKLFSASVVIDEKVEHGIESCFALGPLHNPPNLLGIRIAKELFPGLTQVAVFDTAFHQSMPAHAYLYATPYEWFERYDVRKYGFHGSSHRFVSAQAVKLLKLDPRRHGVVVAHLGNGCSACAVADGKSVDTTMGLTPLEGLVMGTRSGDVDPALIAFMAQRLNCDAAKVTDLLNKQSGLLGVSGVSNDMRSLLEARAKGNARADLALEVFCYRLAKHLAGLAMSLDRLDALVFTGGIGENSVPTRERTLHHLRAFGFRCDPARNAVHGRDSGGKVTVDSSTTAVVVPTNEELVIAMDTAGLVK